MENLAGNVLPTCNICSNFPDCPVKGVLAINNRELTVDSIGEYIHQVIGNEGNSHQKTHFSNNGRATRTTTLTLLSGAARVTCMNPKTGAEFNSTVYEPIEPATNLEATAPLVSAEKSILLSVAGQVLKYTYDADYRGKTGLHINQLEINLTKEGEKPSGVFNIANISDIHLGPDWMRPFGFTTLGNLEKKLQAVKTGLSKLGVSESNTMIIEGGDFVMRKDKMWKLLGLNSETPIDIVRKGVQIWNKVFGGFSMIKVTGNADVQHGRSAEVYNTLLDSELGIQNLIDGFGEPWDLKPENMVLDHKNGLVRIIRTHDYYHQQELVETTPQLVADSIWEAKNKGQKVVVIATHFAKYMEDLEKYDLPDDMVIIMTSGHTHDLNYRYPAKARKINQNKLTGDPNYPWIYGCYQTKKGNVVTVSGGVGVSGATPFSNSNRSVDLISIKY